MRRYRVTSLREDCYKKNDSFFTRRVRDCSGILCERARNGIRERGFGNLEIFFERGKIKRAKIERKARRRSCKRRRNAQRELKIGGQLSAISNQRSMKLKVENGKLVETYQQNLENQRLLMRLFFRHFAQSSQLTAKLKIVDKVCCPLSVDLKIIFY